MPRRGLNHELVIEAAAKLANEHGLNYVTIASLAEFLQIKKPSLYNHIESQESIYKDLMIYGWKHMSEALVRKCEEEDPEVALRSYAKEVYHFALENPGIFEAMKWYNKYENEELKMATEGLYRFFFTQMDKLGIDERMGNHLLRTYRAFLEGYMLLVIHNSFGNPISIEESFDISLEVMIEGIKQFIRSEKNISE